MAEWLIPLFRDAYPEITFRHPRRRSSRSATTRPTVIGLFFDDKECVHQPCDFRHRRAAPHRRLHPRRRSDRGAAADRARRMTAGRSPSPMSASPCRARRRANTGTTPTAGARSSRFLKDGGLPRHLHRPETDARHRPRVEPHPARRRGRDRRPAARGARALAAPCGVFRRPVERAVVARLGGGHAGRDDQRLHASDQRVRDALPGDQLSHLQQLLERPAASASTTRIFCGARATRTRRGSSNARG